MRSRRPRRTGLTLIEMVLTFAIGMLILLAVFMVMRSQYTQTEAGREAIEEATIARNVLNRIGSDVVNSLGPVDPRFLPVSVIPDNANIGVTQVPPGGAQAAQQAAAAQAASNGTSGTSSTGNMSNGSTTPSNGSTGKTSMGKMSTTTTKGGKTVSAVTVSGAGGAASMNGASAGNAASGANSASNSANSASNSAGSSSSGTTMTPVPYNLGVKGDTNWLVISSNRIPGALLGSKSQVEGQMTNPSTISSDLRSLSIWMVDGAGLARNEMAAVTSDDAPTGEPSFSDPKKYVIAPQVQDVLFEYFDGTTWQPSWDGGQLGGSDGNTPIGPPAAIAITITLRARKVVDAEGTPPARKYKHVVALPATNAFSMANQSGQGETLSGQSLVPALQAGTQLSTSSLTNPPPSMQSGSSGSANSMGQ